MALNSEKKDTKREMKDIAGKRDMYLPCFPLYPPVELFHSFGFCPVVMWNNRSVAHSSGVSTSHLQNYVCSVAADLIDELLEPDFPPFEAFFTYNACDTLRNLPEIVQAAFAASSRKAPEMLALHIPVSGFHSENARKYFSLQMKSLINTLKALSGHSFSAEKFCTSIELYRKVRDTFQAAEALVAAGKLEYKIFSDAVAQCGMIPPEKQVEIFETIMHTKYGGNVKGVPVIVSGILPPPPEIIEYLGSAGLRVAVNDIAAEGRSFNTPTPDCDEPVEYYIKFYGGHHPCTTLLFTADRRIDALIAQAEAAGARGLIFLGEKFCEYEYFEIVHLEEKLKARGIPALKLEFSRDDGGSYGSMKTRIDAFAELITK